MSHQAGIEAIGFYGGSAFIDVDVLAHHRGLDQERFENLLMQQKAVALPCEDPVSFAINAAKPLVDSLSAADRDSIEMVITCSESGIDFGKPMSSYVHDLLGLHRNCRLFELKSACYSGTAGFSTAVNYVLSQASPGGKALVVTTDMAKYLVAEGGSALSADWSFAEPSGGAGAIAMLISDQPRLFSVDVGANGFYGYEVMDTCRPIPDSEAGDADLSLLSYLDCCEGAFRDYLTRVPEVDYVNTFDQLCFHTPFGGMVKGAHRSMVRRFARDRASTTGEDFTRRVWPGLTLCRRVGNIMGGSLFLNLLGTLLSADFSQPRRLGCFAYGSGCSSEFFSGVANAESQRRVEAAGLTESLDRRLELSMAEYDHLMSLNDAVAVGTRNWSLGPELPPNLHDQLRGSGRYVLSAINEFHREYTQL